MDETPGAPADLDERLQACAADTTASRVRARHPVNAPMIALWADALGDPNPVYVDDEAAVATGRPGLVAPATMVQAWTMPPLPALARTLAGVPGYAYWQTAPGGTGPAAGSETAPEGEPGPVAAAHRLLTAAGFAARAATRCCQAYHREARPGDHLTCTSTLASVSSLKRTALGAGYFLTTRMVFTDQDERDVATMDWTVLCFRPGAGGRDDGAGGGRAAAPDRGARDAASGPARGPAAGHAAAAEGTRDAGGPAPVARRCVPLAKPPAPGDRLPGATIPVTETFVVATAFATQDYYAAHHDTDWTRSGLGRPGIFTNILTTTGLVGGVVTDWAGPAARLLEVDLALLAPNHAGDTLLLDGEVTTVRDDVAEVAVTGRNGLGPHVRGTVTVRLAPA